MRIHHLQVTAFGPFPGQVGVDFDDLTDSGLFLVHGPTGAGKTSLLDAVCFALYAGVPGGRASGTTLRSHHAADGAVPSVVLELTAAGRRLRLRRQPAYTKPGRTNPVPATVSLEEHRGGAWEVLSTRHDEVGDVVKDVMGMGRQQFERVVVLPQGEFAAFLKANAEERRKVLDSLFDVSTYTDVEAWLVEQRRALAARVETDRSDLVHSTAALADLLSRLPGGLKHVPAPMEADSGSLERMTCPTMSDDEAGAGRASTDAAASEVAAADAAMDDGPGDESFAVLLDSRPDPEELRGVLTVVDAVLEDALTQALVAHDSADLASRAAQTRQAAQVALRSGQDKGTRALADRDRLARSAEPLVAVRAQVAAAERAAPVGAHLDIEAAAAAELDQRRTEADAAVEAVLAHGVDVGPGGEGADSLLVTVRAFDGRLEELCRLADELAAARPTAARLLTRVDRLSDQLQTLADAVAAARTEVEHLTVTEADLSVRDAAVPGLEGLLADLGRRHALRVAVDRGVLELEAGEARLLERRAAEQTARSAYLDLREARLDGMAAELAGGLSDGDPCPVCGSGEHPLPARTEAAAVSADDVAAAEEVHRRLADLREADGDRLAAQRGAQETRLVELADDSRDAAALGRAVADATASLASAREAQGLLAAVRGRLVGARAALEDATSRRTRLAEDLSGAVASVDAHRTQTDRVARAFIEAADLHDTGCGCGFTEPDGSEPPVEDLARSESAASESAASESAASESAASESAARRTARHEAVRAMLARLAEAVEQVADCSARLARLSTAAEAAVASAGFPNADAARTAALPPDVVAQLRERLARHDEDTAAVNATLADPDIVHALRQDAADVEAACLHRDRAHVAATEAVRRLTQVQGAREAGIRLGAEIRRCLTDLSPLLARQRLLTEVADAVAGGGSNTLRMPLSSYVLAARLERVAALANERLAVMGDGRFELRHTDDRSGNARSGLGLEVVDLWTGRPRATSTLSGGESFMASLALALGLADAVREEAGGIDLQTLFVDEGFGTLDDESLEQVLSVLDTLRDGGRAVGVVSHVADLRQRIPRQLKVTKTPHGSTADVLDLGVGA